MARYEPIDMVNHYRGKICSHSDTYFQKRGNTLCTGRICNPRDLSKHPLSADEIAVRDKFRQARAAVLALTSEQRSAYETAFAIHLKSPHPKYQTLAGFIFAPPSLSGARRVRAEVCSFRPHWMRTLY